MLLVTIFAVEGLIIRYTPREYYKIWRWLFAGVLAYLAYHVYVAEAFDLFRHHEQIELYRRYGFVHAIESGKIWSNTLSTLSYVLFSFADSNNWYQTVAIFVIYHCLYSVIWVVANDNGYDNKWLAKCTLFVNLCFNYFQAVFALRMWVVFAIFAYACYVECVQKRKKLLCWIIYVGCIFFHYASVILIVARIAAMFASRIRRKIDSRDMFLMLVTAGVTTVASLLIIESPLGDLILRKIDEYSTYYKRGTWQTIAAWVRIGSVAALAFGALRRNGIEKEYALLVLLVSFIVAARFSNYQLTLRFGDGLIALAPCFIKQTSQVQKKHNLEIEYEDAFVAVPIIVNVLYTVVFDYNQLYFVF